MFSLSCGLSCAANRGNYHLISSEINQVSAHEWVQSMFAINRGRSPWLRGCEQLLKFDSLLFSDVIGPNICRRIISKANKTNTFNSLQRTSPLSLFCRRRNEKTFLQLWSRRNSLALLCFFFDIWKSFFTLNRRKIAIFPLFTRRAQRTWAPFCSQQIFVLQLLTQRQRFSRVLSRFT